MDPVLRRYLTSLQAAGVRRIPRGTAPVVASTTQPGGASAETSPPSAQAPTPGRAADRGAPTQGAPAPAAATETSAAPERAAPPDDLEATLEALSRPRPAGDPPAVLAAVAEEVVACTACKLCEQRTHAVPGEGNPRARIVFIGEGPGADEDKSGRPFVGRAGQLLDDIIVKGMKLKREDVFIANVVKCRPPANRTPEADEVAACAGFLERQIDAIAPAVICALGATAARRLLDTDRPMGRLRGGTYSYRGIPVIPTYHPAYLLRNPAAKRPTWEDVQRVLEIASR